MSELYSKFLDAFDELSDIYHNEELKNLVAKYRDEDDESLNEDYDMNTKVSDLSNEQIKEFCENRVTIPNGIMKVAIGDKNMEDNSYDIAEYPIEYTYEVTIVDVADAASDEYGYMEFNIHGECNGLYDDYRCEMTDIDTNWTLSEFEAELIKFLHKEAWDMTELRYGDFDPFYNVSIPDRFDECINEDTVKVSDHKWTNKGKEGTHGTFRTKKEADAQRKAMFANGYNEDLNREFVETPEFSRRWKDLGLTDEDL